MNGWNDFFENQIGWLWMGHGGLSIFNPFFSQIFFQEHYLFFCFRIF